MASITCGAVGAFFGRGVHEQLGAVAAGVGKGGQNRQPSSGMLVGCTLFIRRRLLRRRPLARLQLLLVVVHCLPRLPCRRRPLDVAYCRTFTTSKTNRSCLYSLHLLSQIKQLRKPLKTLSRYACLNTLRKYLACAGSVLANRCRPSLCTRCEQVMQPASRRCRHAHPLGTARPGVACALLAGRPCIRPGGHLSSRSVCRGPLPGRDPCRRLALCPRMRRIQLLRSTRCRNCCRHRPLTLRFVAAFRCQRVRGRCMPRTWVGHVSRCRLPDLDVGPWQVLPRIGGGHRCCQNRQRGARRRQAMITAHGRQCF